MTVTICTICPNCLVCSSYHSSNNSRVRSYPLLTTHYHCLVSSIYSKHFTWCFSGAATKDEKIAGFARGSLVTVESHFYKELN